MEARSLLLDFAFIPNIGKQLAKLADELAMEENWDYSGQPDIKKYPILFNYLSYTFERLLEENQIAMDDEYACFNTGLATENQEQIFMFFKKNNRPNLQTWLFMDFLKESHRLLSRFDPLPEVAHYFNDPSELLFDTRLNVRVDIDHIIDDNIDRFPSPYNDPAHHQELRLMIDGAVADAKKRIRRNYKAAIPQFYKNRIQLLLPLCILDKKRADLALVVYRENNIYVGMTVLTLDMAYNNARRIARPDTEWLDPIKIL